MKMYGASDIMSSDKKGIDANCGENNLYREGADFDTVAKTEELIVDAASKSAKQVDGSIMKMADDNSLYSESGK